MSQLKELNAQLNMARTALEAALAAGEDTTAARYSIAKLENEISAVERAQRQQRDATARAEATAIEQAAADVAAQAHALVETSTEVPGLSDSIPSRGSACSAACAA